MPGKSTMKKISLTQGKFAVVNDIDYVFLMQWKWYFHKGYAVRNSHKLGVPSKRKTIYMHRIVLGRKLGHSDFENGDHKDQNKLNNRRGNLRPATVSQDRANRKSPGGVSKFKGVCWHKEKQKWQAKVRIEGKLKHLGYFAIEVKAAKAYNRAALEHFGAFACLTPSN